MAAKLIPLKITSGSYASVNDHPLYATPELKDRLQKAKHRDGTVVWDALAARGSHWTNAASDHGAVWVDLDI